MTAAGRRPGAGPLLQFGGHQIGIDGPGGRVGVDQDRPGPHVGDHVGRGHEGLGGDEDVVARIDPQEEQGQVESGGAAGQGQGGGDVDQLGPGRLRSRRRGVRGERSSWSRRRRAGDGAPRRRRRAGRERRGSRVDLRRRGRATPVQAAAATRTTAVAAAATNAGASAVGGGHGQGRRRQDEFDPDVGHARRRESAIPWPPDGRRGGPGRRGRASAGCAAGGRRRRGPRPPVRPRSPGRPCRWRCGPPGPRPRPGGR